MFGGSSQLPTTAELVVLKSLSTVQTTKERSAVVVSVRSPRTIRWRWRKFVGWALNFRVRMLLKDAVRNYFFVAKDVGQNIKSSLTILATARLVAWNIVSFFLAIDSDFDKKCLSYFCQFFSFPIMILWPYRSLLQLIYTASGSNRGQQKHFPKVAG